jgi:L-rhamnose mutarotase
MTRIGFVLKVKAELIEEYKRRHEAVWPEMLDALTRNGWHNYTLFMRPDGTLFGYFETAGSFAEAINGMAAEEINARWQQEMAPFFEGADEHADTMMEELAEVFHLD